MGEEFIYLKCQHCGEEIELPAQITKREVVFWSGNRWQKKEYVRYVVSRFQKHSCKKCGVELTLFDDLTCSFLRG